MAVLSRRTDGKLVRDGSFFFPRLECAVVLVRMFSSSSDDARLISSNMTFFVLLFLNHFHGFHQPRSHQKSNLSWRWCPGDNGVIFEEKECSTPPSKSKNLAEVRANDRPL